MFQLHSTRDFLSEVIANLRKNNSNAPGHLTANVAEKIEQNLDEVVRDFPGGAPFDGCDKDDYHVHAAAVASPADIILTTDDPTLHDNPRSAELRDLPPG